MFKDNRAFWLSILGTIVLMFVLFYIMSNYFTAVNLSDFGFGRQAIVTPTPTELIVNSDLDPTKDYRVIIKTNLGDFTIDLFEDSAPNTVKNFLYLTSNDFYNGLTFHRLIPNVLIQGGSPNTLNNNNEDDQFGGPGYTINHEINWDSLNYASDLRQELTVEGYSSTEGVVSKRIAKYRVAMAAAGPNKIGSQFFIVLGESTDPRVAYLEGRHTVFGEVVQNSSLINDMSKIEIDNPLSTFSRPVQTIVINEIKLEIRDR